MHSSQVIYFIRYFKVTEFDLSNLDTSYVTNMSHMFVDSRSTSLNLSSFNTSRVTTVSSIFQKSSVELLNLSSFDTKSLYFTGAMFSNCNATYWYAKTQIDANKFNASSKKPSELNFIVKS